MSEITSSIPTLGFRITYGRVLTMKRQFSTVVLLYCTTCGSARMCDDYATSHILGKTHAQLSGHHLLYVPIYPKWPKANEMSFPLFVMHQAPKQEVSEWRREQHNQATAFIFHSLDILPREANRPHGRRRRPTDRTDLSEIV